MSYDDVEKALGLEPPPKTGKEKGRSEELWSTYDSDSSNALSAVDEDEAEDNENDDNDDDDSDDDNDSDEQPDTNQSTTVTTHAINLDLDEAYECYIPEDLRQITLPEQRALAYHIKQSLEQEAYADGLDARAAYQEEKHLWAMLQQNPPPGQEPVRAAVPQKEPGPQKRYKAEMGHWVYPGSRGVLNKVGMGAVSSWEWEYMVQEGKEKKKREEAGEEDGDEDVDEEDEGEDGEDEE
ncbi:hypothetical protein B0T17DRAFT_635478 [Bombardia bombarda]|uniref:Uncharacterized protein n=1 Tax=Bombardia bombarda TaxID=252184 RepID=A0AA39X9S7_9PEZI|nr:hypothetical protein B0T17DRAFT_635478 [Bombardia bombarda]